MLKSISINKKDYKWRTTLMYAVSDWDIERVSELIKLWADINIQNNDWYTALMWAAYNKNIEILAFLLANKADVSILDNKWNGFVSFLLKDIEYEDFGNKKIEEMNQIIKIYGVNNELYEKMWRINLLKELNKDEKKFITWFSRWWFFAPISVLFYVKKRWLAKFCIFLSIFRPVFIYISKIFPWILLWFKIRKMMFLNIKYDNFEEFKLDVISKENKYMFDSIIFLVVFTIVIIFILSLIIQY